ncbi:HAMP domain-containing protein [Caldifermentibacillus hisashii]|jgi:methyl-accepting chemotaxis protein|uniref:HAMP domain-containing protein n=1 Tax=Caldifermentibacillus hisashii TaxID=996558 RepID=UPI003D1E8F61
MVVTISQATKDGSGVVGIDISLAYIQELVKEVEIGKEGYAILLDQNGSFIYHPDYEGMTKATESLTKQLSESNSGEFTYNTEGENRIMRFVTNETTGWKVGGNLAISEVNGAAQPIFQKTFLIIAVAFIIGAIIVFFIIRSIIKPINALNAQALAISQGDLSKPIDVTTNDEIGQLANAMKTMQSMLKNMIVRITSASERMADHSEELTQTSNEVSAGTE